MENNETRTFPNFDPTNDLSQVETKKDEKRIRDSTTFRIRN